METRETEAALSNIWWHLPHSLIPINLHLWQPQLSSQIILSPERFRCFAAAERRLQLSTVICMIGTGRCQSLRRNELNVIGFAVVLLSAIECQNIKGQIREMEIL